MEDEFGPNQQVGDHISLQLPPFFVPFENEMSRLTAACCAYSQHPDTDGFL